MAYKNKTDQAAAGKRYYEANKEKSLAQVRARTFRVRDEIRAYIVEYLIAHPCLVCGEADPVVLEFDHRDPSSKEFEIAEAAKRQMAYKRIDAEIAKCDVLCANCHRRKTYVQMGWKSKEHTRTV